MWVDDYNIGDLVGNEIESMCVEEMYDGMSLEKYVFEQEILKCMDFQQVFVYENNNQ